MQINQSLLKQFNTKTYTIKEWKRKYTSKYFNDSGLFIQLEAGWYYFECNYLSLKRKTKIYSKIIKGLNENCSFDINKHAIMFLNFLDQSNNQTDEIRIYNVETDKVVCSIEYKVNIGQFNIFSDKDNFELPVILHSDDEVIDYMTKKEE